MDEPLSFGALVRRRRKALDLTQRALAHRVGCAEVTIQKIEAEERRPSTDVAQRLADVFGLTDPPRAAFLRRARGQLDDSAALPAVAPTATAAAAPPHNLPAELTSFIGRARELAEVRSLAAEHRLLTLVGPGGTGKTRLALRLAAELQPAHPEGVWLVELAPLRDPMLVAQAVATVLDIREEPGRTIGDTLRKRLVEQHLLVLLDNCEHLVDACAVLADELLRGCPHVHLLCTSREALGIAGETTVHVPPLELPVAHAGVAPGQAALPEAMQLFVERAQSADPHWTLTDANRAAVAEICCRLDGIPLALELAAARIRFLTAEQIAARLTDRFRLLTGGSRTALARHQTLAAMIDWSYELLSGAERTLLWRLTVFRGGWTLAAAEAVCAGGAVDDVVDTFARLVDKSMVQVEQHASAARYTMLETIRAYMREHLADSGEGDTIARRHAAHYLAATQWRTATPGPAGLVDDPETDNLRAALDWSLASPEDGALAMELAARYCLWWAWWRGLTNETQTVLERAIAHPQAAELSERRADVCGGMGNLLGARGEFAAACRWYEQALQLYEQLGDPVQRAWVIGRLGWIAREQDDTVTARRLLEESLALYNRLGEKIRNLSTLNTLAEVEMMEHNVDHATALLEHCLAVAQEHEHWSAVAWALNHLGHVAQVRAEYGQARSFHEQSAALFQEHLDGDFWPSAWSWQSLGDIALATGDYAAAGGWLSRSLAVRVEAGEQMGISWCLTGVGTLAASTGSPMQAVQLWGAAESLQQALGCRPSPASGAVHERAIAAARSELGEAAFAQAWVEGRAMLLDRAIAWAQAYAGTVRDEACRSEPVNGNSGT